LITLSNFVGNQHCNRQTDRQTDRHREGIMTVCTTLAHNIGGCSTGKVK